MTARGAPGSDDDGAADDQGSADDQGADADDTDRARPRRPLAPLGARVAGVVRHVGRWADVVDRAETVPTAPVGEDPPAPRSPGVTAAAWAIAKATLGMATAPVSLPTLAVAARRTSTESVARTEAFPAHLHDLAEGRPTDLPAPAVQRVASDRRWLITSDLHRCVPGRIDWPGRQGTKELYAHMLEHYAADGWGLIENGDVEDFWMTGGSTWGAVNDVARIAAGIAAPVDDTLRSELLGDQLDRAVDNNARTYQLIRDGFLADGRYHRTIGNHDEVYSDPALVARLAQHLPGVHPVDTILLAADDRPGIAHVDAVVTHGHLTDSWNGPGWSALGRAITWVAIGLDDLPLASGDEGLPDEAAVDHLLAGRGRNRLITLDPRWGGNRRFDSLDEERLFDALRRSEPDGGWPWMLFGHTHYPMLWPTSRAGGTVRYANSGCGVLRNAVTALEWDPDGADEGDPVRLVIWVDEGDGPARIELVPDGGALRVG